MASIPVALPGAIGVTTLPVDPATVEAIDRRQRERASAVAAEGVELARSVGLDVEAQSVSDKVNVADRLLDMAREREASVVVVGSHGISGLRTRLLGSVSRTVIEHCDRPVLVIRDDSA